jgi:hypothetical protein
MSAIRLKLWKINDLDVAHTCPFGGRKLVGRTSIEVIASARRRIQQRED